MSAPGPNALSVSASGQINRDGLPWSDAEIDTVRAMTAEGFSGSQIAKKIGRSRNAVIGIRHRLKIAIPEGTRPKPGPTARLPPKPKPPCAPAPAKAAKAAAAPKAPPQAKPRPLDFRGPAAVEAGPALVVEVAAADAFDPLPGSAPVPFDQRGFERCCWPIDLANQDEAHACNQPAHGPYCASHARLSYRPTQKLKVDTRALNQGYAQRRAVG